MCANVATRDTTLRYSHCVGQATQNSVDGFNLPTDIALSREGLMYVLNRPLHGVSRVDFRTVVNIVSVDSEYFSQFGGYGAEDGKFIWPVSIAFDSEERLFVSDEHLNRISFFDKDGEFLGKWGREGSGDGEFNRPAGIAFDKDDNLWVADDLNHRLQKFTKEGEYLGQFGGYGTGPGQFDMPWGVSIDGEGYIYVADWRNDRIQKFTPEGELVARFGGPNGGGAKLNRPSYLAVDRDGDIYVSDGVEDYVHVLSPDGSLKHTLRGEAGLSKWAERWLAASPEQLKQREKADLEPEKWFWKPMGIAVDSQNRVYIADCGRYRIQIYEKKPAG